MYEKRLRDNNEKIDLRERLSNNRIDPEIVNKVKEQQAILDMAKEKLSGSSSTVDITTAKQLQDMLNMVLEQTNKLQSQLPRSVWDRIAPPEISDDKDYNQLDPLLKGRYIQEIGTKDILITKENKRFMENNEDMSINPMYKKKYGTVGVIEPNILSPLANDKPMLNSRSLQKSSSSPERYHEANFRKQHFGESPWSRDKGFEKNRWGESSSSGRRQQCMSPMRKHVSPMRHRLSPSRRFSPKRPLLSPPRRPLSPPRKHMSPLRRPVSPFRSRNNLMGRPFSPQNRPMSGSRRPLSPPRRPASPSRRLTSPPRRILSPLIRTMSPKRHVSPLKQHVSSVRTITPPRRQISPVRHQMSLSKRHLSPSRRMMSPSRREIQSSRRMLMQQDRQQRQSNMRMEASFRIVSSRRPMSPPPRRQLSPPRRQITPPKRFTDDWDIPSRGAIEQNTWHTNNRIIDKSWRDERQSTNSNWDHQQASSSNRYHNAVNEDIWDIKDSSQDKMGISSSVEDVWNTNQQLSTIQSLKDPWALNFDNRWSSSLSSSSLTNDNWNSREKESFGDRDESWMDKNKNKWDTLIFKDSWDQQGDKDDWNDLPEDAKDPWGDDNSSIVLKDRWQKYDGPGTSIWAREHEKVDSWSNEKDNWQSKGQSAGTSKSIWHSNNNQNVVGDARWIVQSDMSKKLQPSSGCQSGSSALGSWQQQSVYNIQSQRSFTMTQYKDHC